MRSLGRARDLLLRNAHVRRDHCKLYKAAQTFRFTVVAHTRLRKRIVQHFFTRVDCSGWRVFAICVG